MPVAKALQAQRDFSAGEVDTEAKRNDQHPLVKAGVRHGANWRILNAGGLRNRPGRRALFIESDRVDEVLVAPGTTYYLAFPSGKLRVYDSTGAQVFTESGKPWTSATAKSVVWALYDKTIIVCFAGMQPRVLTWDGVTTWTAADYAETVTAGNQKRTIFYRVSPKGVTMVASGTHGSVTLTFSAGMNLTAAFIGTRMRYVNRQVLITTVASATSATATVEESLPHSQDLVFGVDPTPFFNVGDVVIGTVTSARGIVTAINAGTNTVTVQLLNTTATATSGGGGSDIGGGGAPVTVIGFSTADAVAGPGGSLTPSSTAIGFPQAVTYWDDEVMNSLRGWPSSVVNDQGRLIFSNFPSVPRGIAWSAFGLPNDLYVGSDPTSAMFELAPENGQVFHVTAGPDGSEFVFCDNGVWQIPISATNPLKPGSVGFERVTADGCANVQPRSAMEYIFYLSAGLTRVMAIVPTGNYTHSYASRDLTEMRTHLFVSPIAIAVPTADGTFPERHIYVLNSDGTVVVGKFTVVDGQVNITAVVGWLPWSGGTVKWIAARGSDVIFTTSYAPNAITPVQIVERLDDTLYLDGGLAVNAIPTALTPPGGKGPLWWLPSGAVDLMDQTTRMMGTYQIDANGFIVPQNNGGEDLTAVTLIAGQAWNAVFEPFLPNAQPGQDAGQRTKKRRIAQTVICVTKSTGFRFDKLYSEQQGVNLPATGTVMSTRRVTAWNQDDDPTKPPPLREVSYKFRTTGRFYDPRVAVVKDTSGPITVTEAAFEITV